MFRLRCATARQVSACRAEAFGVGGLDASHSFFPMSLAPRALAILHEWVKSESLRKHCYAVADSMKHFAQLRGVFHRIDRKSTRLNSSHGSISYAVFCLKKKIETISPA